MCGFAVGKSELEHETADLGVFSSDLAYSTLKPTKPTS